LPGGNGARNFGFKMSRGDYIQWFDSDDLMMPEKLAVKVKAMLENSVDFVVSRTKYFNAPKSEKDYLYNFDETQVNFESFTTTFISWYTPDFFVCRNAVLNTYFNEDLQSGQEFNFIAKVLINYDKCKIIKQNLTLRRYTSDSIGVSRRQSKTEFQRTTFENSWITFNEVYPLSGFNKSFGQKLLLKCMKAYVEIRDIQKPNRFFMEIVKFYNFKAIYFFLSLISFRLFSKYVYFFKKLR
jgi:glycosyltransferase involved in cell wall biosynthesis